MKKKTILVLALVILLLCGILLFAFQEHIKQVEVYVKLALSAYVQSFGAMGFFVVFFIQILQVIVAVFPSVPIQVVAGGLYGFLGGFISCYSGTVLANCAIFAIVKKYGLKYMPKVLNSHFEKFKQSNIATKKAGMFLTILYLVPFLPNGIVPYIAAGTNLTFTKFALTISIACLPAVALYCYTGSSLTEGNMTKLAILLLLIMITSAVSFAFKDSIMKGHKSPKARK